MLDINDIKFIKEQQWWIADQITPYLMKGGIYN